MNKPYRQVGRFRVYQGKAAVKHAALLRSRRGAQCDSAIVQDMTRDVEEWVQGGSASCRDLSSEIRSALQSLVLCQATVELPGELKTIVTQFQMVWVRSELRDGRLYFAADSDAALTKGLAALLVRGLSGCTPEEIVAVDPTFIEQLGLKQSLTPSRNNGFLNMFRLMQRHALEHLERQGSVDGATAEGSNVSTNGNGSAEASSNGSGNGSAQASSNGSGNGSAAPNGTPPTTSAAGAPTQSIQAAMRGKLEAALKPARLVIDNQSDRHAGHAGVRDAPAGAEGETHFAVEVVSTEFGGLNAVKRHRMVYALLKEEFARGLHALSLTTMTPEEAGVPK